MLEYLLNALDAGTPTANHAKEDVVGEICAIFAFAHMLMQLGESCGDFDEESIDIYIFEFV